jgi:hypothetical protein
VARAHFGHLPELAGRQRSDHRRRWLRGSNAAAFSAQLANGTAVLRTVYQAQLNTFVEQHRWQLQHCSPVGQWTIQADFSEYARALLLGAPSIALTPFAGTVSIFYNATAVAMM